MAVVVSFFNAKDERVEDGQGYDVDERGVLHIYNTAAKTGREVAAFRDWSSVKVENLDEKQQDGNSYNPVSETK